MLTKTKMQEIQDLKLQGYTKADIIRYYEAQGRKPPSRPTLFFASTFSSKMQIDFLKVAWGISPLLHFLLRHSFGCRRGVVAGIQSLLVTDM